MIDRKNYELINEWYLSNRKSALLIEGARQTGKTHLIRRFLKDNSCKYIEINFFENKRAFDSLSKVTNSEDFFMRLSILQNGELIENESIIFLDEIQFIPDILTLIKFLVEDGRYRYILSGSLLGIELKNIRSIPVGYLETINMYPLDFEEFITAYGVNKKVISYLKDCFINKKAVDEEIHKQMISLMHLYLIVGGMPNAVDTFIKTKNITDVHKIINKIIDTYRDDISKYDHERNLQIKELYDIIPSELNNPNKRFILKNANNKARYYQYEESFSWIKNSGTGLFVYNIDEPVYPLLRSKDRNLFKLFLNDVGMLCNILYFDNIIDIYNGECNLNYGAIYEAFVAQELKCHGFDLYYYNNKTNGEVDFMIEHNGKVLPIEVKSGKDYKRHNAMCNLLEKYPGIKNAYVFSNYNISIKDKKTYLPIYMVMFMKKRKELGNIILNPIFDKLM